MNFLELCQATARESGVVSGVLPVSVTGQRDRLLQIVSWTAEAWKIIQNDSASWRFMRKEFPDTARTTANTSRYLPDSFSINDHAEWLRDNESSLTIYNEALGAADEGEVNYIDWPDWRRLYSRGIQTTDRPTYWTVSPSNQLCFGKTPNATYRVRGEYRRSPQLLVENTDTPFMPPRFHEMIVWRAVLLLDEHDEAPPVAAAQARLKYLEYLGTLRRDQLPRIRVTAAPVA